MHIVQIQSDVEVIDGKLLKPSNESPIKEQGILDAV